MLIDAEFAWFLMIGFAATQFPASCPRSAKFFLISDGLIYSMIDKQVVEIKFGDGTKLEHVKGDVFRLSVCDSSKGN